MKKNFTNSDIFNSYIELAQKEGLVSLAQDSSDSKKALDKNPRADSLSQERIGELYNVKPNAPKGMEYKRNIGEVAHSKPAIVGPAYDKLNALVESDNERQDILLHIVNKRTNGLLTQHKYAQEEMARALVRIANDMDNRNQDDLRALADECLEGLTKEAWSISEILSGSDVPSFLRPFASAIRADVPAVAIGSLAGAIIGSTIPLVGTIAGAGTGAEVGLTAGLVLGPIISAMWGQAPEVRNMSTNSEHVIKCAEAILPYIKGEDQSYLKEFIKELKKLKELSDKFYDHAKGFKEKKDEGQEITELHVNEATEDCSELNSQIAKVEGLIEQYLARHFLITDQYKTNKQMGETKSRLVEWFSPMISAINPPLELKDAVIALDETIGKHMEAKMTSAERAKYKLEKYYNKFQEKTKSFFDNKPSVSPPSNDNMTPEQKAAARRVVDFIKNS
jgi:hypothetical protein